MLSVGLVAIDSTILATAVPSIVDDLGGFAQFPWLFSIFLLAQAVSVPIFAKFSDLVGRKPIMLIGVGLFVLGSILCGIAWSMPALIAFRALQGLGAGAVQPTAMTIIGDIYTVAERAKVQGYVASVWAISAVVGPTLGGLFVDFADWRWIFFVNIPLGAVAAWSLVRRFPSRSSRRAASHRPRRRGPAERRHLAADPRAARGRRPVALGLGAEHRDPCGRRVAAGRLRRWSSAAPLSRSCPAGSSAAGCSTRPTSPPWRSA